MTINFAHRGSLTEAPENTIPSFKYALKHGAQAIELDVQLSKDNHLIVWHDATFSRFNKNETRRLNTYTLEEIKQINVGEMFPNITEPISPATLEEVLAICPPDVTLNIEIKNIPLIHQGIEKALFDCLHTHNRLENIIVSSFDHVALQNFQQLAPKVRLGMLFYYRILNPWSYAQQSGLNIYSIHPNNIYTDRLFIEKCRQHGFHVYPFTVNSTQRYHELIEFGVSGVFSDAPDIFGTD